MPISHEGEVSHCVPLAHQLLSPHTAFPAVPATPAPPGCLHEDMNQNSPGIRKMP